LTDTTGEGPLTILLGIRNPSPLVAAIPVVLEAAFPAYGARQVRADPLNALSYRNVQLK
jgi:hypothetical protein